MTCETSDAVWFIELKLDRSADEALAQIEKNNYASPAVRLNKMTFKTLYALTK